MQFLAARGYTPIQPPLFMKHEMMAGVAQLEDFHEQLYRVDCSSRPTSMSNSSSSAMTSEPSSDPTAKKSDPEQDPEPTYLIATSEQPLCAYHYGEILPRIELPLLYAGLSTCFRREAGSRKDLRGIFRVHQFEKVEQFCLTTAEDSQKALMRLVDVAAEFYQSLGLPFQLVQVVTGALSMAAIEKIDLEAWFPASDCYRELVSASNCTDYQARAMAVKYGWIPDELPQQTADSPATQKAKGKKKKTKAQKKKTAYAHMVNATLVASQRTLCCILENYQTSDGINVPPPLVPFVGLSHIPFIKK